MCVSAFAFWFVLRFHRKRQILLDRLSRSEMEFLAFSGHSLSGKLHDEASRKLADAECEKIAVELKKRYLEIEIIKIGAEARQAYAYDLFEMAKALETLYDLFKKRIDAGLVLPEDDRGNLTRRSKELEE